MAIPSSRLYSIGIFIENIDSTLLAEIKDSTLLAEIKNSTVLAESDSNLSAYVKRRRESDPVGSRLRALSHATELEHYEPVKRKIFKEFLLAALRCVAGRYDPTGEHSSIDTFEVDLPKSLSDSTRITYSIYVKAELISESVKVIVAVATDATYPKPIKMELADKVMNQTIKRVSREDGSIDIRLQLGLQKFAADIVKASAVKSQRDGPLGEIRTNLDDAKAEMATSIEKLNADTEQLDSMVKQSTDLSMSTKKAYKQVKNMNKEGCLIQ